MQLTSHVRPRIGLFTDTYRPTINGISVVVDTYRRQMEAAGWEVFIICPATRMAARMLHADDHIITLPSIKGWPYKEYDISFFWPPRLARRIACLQLQAVIFFTPGQLGLLTALVAQKTKVPMIAQHSTDVVEYIAHYKSGGIPTALILVAAAPFLMRFSANDWRVWFRAWRPRRSVTAWAQQATRTGLAIWYKKCSFVVALSRKNKKQLQAYPGGSKLRIATIPVGVDAFASAAPEAVAAFCRQWHITPNDSILLYTGRISAEKNLDLLIPALELVIAQKPQAKLMFVGDFDYREALEAKVRQSNVAENVIFTGKLPRESLNVVYASADVFVFPSLTDTQSLVLHEAAAAGLPIVLCDGDVTEVVRDGQNGRVVANNPQEFAQAVLYVLQDPERYRRFCMASKTLAAQLSEAHQTNKLLAYLTELTARPPRR